MRASLSVLCLLPVLAVAQERAQFSDDFGSYANSVELFRNWETLGGAWDVADGRLTTDGGTGRRFASFVSVPESETLVFTADLCVRKRSAPDAWVTAGLCLLLDTANFWQLALVDGPDGTRYAELVEMHASTWQAQREGVTALEQTAYEGAYDSWEYGHDYRLRLTVDAESITGEVIEPATGAVRTRIAYAWADVRAVRCGRPAMASSGLAVAVDRVDAHVVVPAAGAAPVPFEAGAAGRLAILSDAVSGLDPTLVRTYTTALREAGFGVTPLTCAQLADPAILNARHVDGLVLTQSPRFPLAAGETLLRFLRNGGDLLLLGGLAFSEPIWPIDEAWVTTPELLDRFSRLPTRRSLFAFDDELAGWQRATDQPDAGSKLSITVDARGRHARFDVRDIKGWDNVSHDLPDDLPADATALSLWAKADAETPRIAVELRETDGSRWICTLDVTTEWTRYVIPSWRFLWWRDSESSGRGGPSDGLNVRAARSLAIGLARSHVGQITGDHTVWFDDVGIVAGDLPRVTQVNEIQLPAFSNYAVYRLDDVRAIGATKLAAPVAGWSAIGFAWPNESKLERLLAAHDGHGRDRGAAAAMLTHYRGIYRDSHWVLSGITTPAFYRRPDVVRHLVTATKRAVSGEPARALRRAIGEPKPNLVLTTPPPHHGFLRLSDDRRHIVYPDGRRFFMIGCNYVGSFDRCSGRMWREAFYDPAVVEDDFRKARDAGLNVMRYWIQQPLDMAIRAGNTTMVGAIREAARKYGVYLLLDLPGTGYRTEKQMLASHRAIAAAFRDEPMVLGYDLRNEPYVTTLGGLIYTDTPPPVQTRDLRPEYPGRIDNEQLRQWIADRDWWLHLPAWITGETAERVVSARELWRQWRLDTGLATSTLRSMNGGLPRKGWAALVDTVDASLDRWLSCQIAAIREADPNHLITVGHNTALQVLPANKQLDFVSQHIYARPYHYANVIENFTTLDRLKARWPDRPVSLGEFGYSNGIRLGTGYLDDHASSVGEMMHFLYALANGYEGAKKWMLCDWPLAVMRRYGDWDRGLNTRIYEERFGLYYYDGTVGGRPKPIAAALRFLRDYVDRAGPVGTFEYAEGDTPIGAVYRFEGKNALFVGAMQHESDSLAFRSDTATNVMLLWDNASITLMSTADATVRLRPGVFVNGLPNAWQTRNLLAGTRVRIE